MGKERSMPSGGEVAGELWFDQSDYRCPPHVGGTLSRRGENIRHANYNLTGSSGSQPVGRDPLGGHEGILGGSRKNLKKIKNIYLNKVLYNNFTHFN